MNAPYDGDRGQGAGGDPAGHVPPQPPDAAPNAPAPDPARDPYAQAPYSPDQYAQDAYAQDPYVQDAYRHDPYRAQDLSAQDPVSEAMYDRAAHPPPPPGTYPETMPLYQQPPVQQYAPDPRVWAQPPPPEPDGPSRHLPYGDDPRTTQFMGVDELVTRAHTDEREPDAFAHLFRDQEGTGRPRPPRPRRRPRRPRRRPADGPRDC